MKRQRIGMYQRFGGGNIDEGWTRLVLEQFNFPYTSVFDPEIKAGNLIDEVRCADDSERQYGDDHGGGAAGSGGGGAWRTRRRRG